MLVRNVPWQNYVYVGDKSYVTTVTHVGPIIDFWWENAEQATRRGQNNISISSSTLVIKRYTENVFLLPRFQENDQQQTWVLRCLTSLLSGDSSPQASRSCFKSSPWRSLAGSRLMPTTLAGYGNFVFRMLVETFRLLVRSLLRTRTPTTHTDTSCVYIYIYNLDRYQRGLGKQKEKERTTKILSAWLRIKQF